MEVDKLRREVEDRMRKGESFSMKEIRKIMKETGRSYGQVMSQFKKLKKDMDKAEVEALKAGEEFDRDAYISMRMRG